MDVRRAIRGVALSVAVVSAVGCGKGDRADETPTPSAGFPAAPTAPAAPAARPTPTGAAAPAAVEARRLFESSCAMCHGVAGRGDGAMAARLTPRPRDYSDPAWQTSVTDAELARIIVEGGAAVGKSTNMPPNPGLARKPEVVAELVELVRSFSR